MSIKVLIIFCFFNFFLLNETLPDEFFIDGDVIYISDSAQKYVMDVINSYMNTPYRYGGTTKSGIDCSGFVKAVYYSVGINIPRTSMKQSKIGCNVKRNKLQFIDLIFFATRGNRVNHVGLYIQDGIFVHSARKVGVTFDSLHKKYYKKRYLFSKRIFIN